MQIERYIVLGLVPWLYCSLPCFTTEAYPKTLQLQSSRESELSQRGGWVFIKIAAVSPHGHSLHYRGQTDRFQGRLSRASNARGDDTQLGADQVLSIVLVGRLRYRGQAQAVLLSVP
jgi:hypothetical protein